MLKVSRCAIVLLITLVCAIYVPEQVRRLLVERSFSPFILYSSSLKTFMVNARDKETGQRRMTDLSGKEYTRREFETALPMFFYKDLAAWGCLPESLDGEEVTYKKVAMNRQVLSLRPRALNSPVVPLYPLYESASGFTQLEEPDSMFRVTGAFEFLDAATNAVDADRSGRFTKALTRKGFAFPAQGIFGNPTARKPFDEGYFITDAEGTLFHLKMVRGNPWVKNTGLAPASGIRYIGMDENPRREFYGLMIEGDGTASLLSWGNYRPIALPMEGYDPDTMSLAVYCDLLKRTFVMTGKKSVRVWVTDRAYRPIASHTHGLEAKGGQEMLKQLFPLRVVRSKGETAYALLDVSFNPEGWMVSLFCLVGLLGWRMRQRRAGRHPEDYLVVLLTGGCGLLAVALTGCLPEAD
ncbi:DUF4857 domain-containing protein [Desulfoluna butyratoxydans]|uniref:DUF4857 domain-containing protein n=1 Tax=Desulfoluna butyratoxydans TaxID=231438 RepID=A0A4U8YRZ3_9BACT|nr:DUF4857 domain-containing protein [Desulfoluna butyratoxydans]VFQ46247.1 protein of unknown function duf4857 [Desulfoluna butyratoxydans]